ncbi:MAG: polysaccharide deacetylase family protein, partial [Bacteroidota bacterium]|nr:polysaccharide deacetylase family protein [Bacteroidota bacterium]
DDELTIPNCGLLFQDGIKEQSIEIVESNGNKIFFTSSVTNGSKTKYTFDIFSACFYLLSRYEEYLPHKKDKYGRYSHKNSLAFKENFLQLPLINIWLNDFTGWLQKQNGNFQFQKNSFRFIPTYDVDLAYSFLHKGVTRTTVGGLQALLGLKFDLLNQRLKVLSGNKKDPFDNYNWLDELHLQYDLKPLYFFLVAEKNGTYDRNILPSTKAMQQLIKQHAEKYSIGLHPSWQSGDEKNLIKKEKEILENISNYEIFNSRQHYIRFNLPEGYRSLIESGITDDYSMGYGASNGFRASVASSFYWYDLENNVQTKLKAHPFCYMDSTAIFIQKLSTQQAYNEMLHYYNICKNVKGEFIAIMHNNNLREETIEWKNIYKGFLNYIMKAE